MEKGELYYLPREHIEAYIQKSHKEFKDYEYLGSHFMEYKGVKGVCFMVLAPNAENINVVAEFNNWDGKNHPMRKIEDKGLWHIFICGLEELELYKYEVHSKDQRVVLKADPYGFHSEKRSNTASMVVSLNQYKWKDQKWRDKNNNKSKIDENMSIYEVHLGSWKRKDNGNFYNYRELAHELLEYVVDMGYTHIELMPLMEHPFDGSWGYQITGYFSVTSRYGSPQDFMYFIDQCHQKEIGVILDWVPGHFCKDKHGLEKFDGSTLYEYDNPIMAENVEWDTLSFDHGKKETTQFLISNALFWLEVYHIDGLRVDAVSYMLFLDAGRTKDKWIPNENGGRENLCGIKFLKKLNTIIHQEFPGTLMIAEESTAWPNVTGSVEIGGLGFDLKWNMGWMNDVLKYMDMDPLYRKWHHNLICFSFVYAFSEKYILVLSHDEVVHGKKSLIGKMPGEYWNKFANLRAFYGYMIGHPGKKLLFMGGEFAQFIEWNHDNELDWLLLEYESHRKMKCFIKELNHLCKTEKSLYQLDHSSLGFEWIDSQNYEESIIVFMRKAVDPDDFLIVVCNFTPVMRENYIIGVPKLGEYKEVFNSDSERYGGSGVLNEELIKANELTWNNQPYSIAITIPPLGVTFIKLQKSENDLTEKSMTKLNADQF